MFNITFQQIEAFLTVGLYANLSKAAEAMFISQPALSKMLQRFEEGLSMQLFTRSNQGLVFTDEGRFLFSKLGTMYQSINDTIKIAQQISMSHSKTLHIATPSSYDAASSFDPVRKIVECYCKKHPLVVLKQTLYDFSDLRSMLELGGVDLAVAQDFSIADIPGITYKSIWDFRLYIAASEEINILKDGKLDLDQLRNEYFFTVPIPGHMKEQSYTLQRCRRMGFLPKDVVLVPNFQTQIHNVRKKSGVSICGCYDLLGFDDIKYYPLPDPENQAKIVIAWQNGRLSKEAQDFIDLLPDGKITVNE